MTRLATLSLLLCASALPQAVNVNPNPTNNPNQINVTTGYLYLNKMHYAGTWTGAATYSPQDVVFYAGVPYVSLLGGNLNRNPSAVPAYWAAFPGGVAGASGVNGQLQYNVGGVLGGFTLAGDCTFAVPNVVCTKTGGVAFGSAATQASSAFDASGLATAAQAAAIAASAQRAANLSDLANPGTARTNLGLAPVAASGSAADLSGNLAVARLNGGTGASPSTFWRGDGSWAAAGVGSVTGVTFTGGIVSIANPTSAPAFTIAGTPGGVVYFSGAATWASSAAGAAATPMLWGGAGNAPTGAGSLSVTNAGTATETWTLYNATPTTGTTTLTLRNGAVNPEANPILKFLKNDGTLAGSAYISGDGVLFKMATLCLFGGNTQGLFCNGSTVEISNRTIGVLMSSASPLSWTNTSSASTGTVDTGLTRDSAGVVDVGNGVAGNTSGSMKLTNLTMSGVLIVGGKSCTINTTTGVWTCV